MISVERRGAVAVIRYANPPRNFLTLSTISELSRVWRELDRDPDVRVIIFTGRPGHFMLHVEVDELAAMLRTVPRMPRPVRVLVAITLRWLARWPWLLERLLVGGMARTAAVRIMMLHRAIERSSKSTLAVIEGPCMGGGLELALCFDQRITSDAPEVELGLPESLIGIIPGFGGTQRLARRVGPERALAMMLEGELVGAERALEIGLVTRVVPREQLWQRVVELADKLAARSPLVVAALKRAVRDGAARSLDRGLSLELVEVAGLAPLPSTRVAVETYASHLARLLKLPEAEQPTLTEVARIVEQELREASRSASHR